MPKRIYTSEKTDKVLQGRIAKFNGQRFESRIEASLEWYRAKGLAIIEKTPEPMRPVRSLGEGRFIAIFEKKAQPDYKGTLAGGRSIVLEAKYTASGKLEQSRVKAHQEVYLDKHEKLGAKCFVIGGYETGNVYMIPWSVWRQMKDLYGRKHITEDDVKQFRVPEMRDGTLLILEAANG